MVYHHFPLSTFNSCKIAIYEIIYPMGFFVGSSWPVWENPIYQTNPSWFSIPYWFIDGDGNPSLVYWYPNGWYPSPNNYEMLYLGHWWWEPIKIKGTPLSFWGAKAFPKLQSGTIKRICGCKENTSAVQENEMCKDNLYQARMCILWPKYMTHRCRLL